MKNIKLIKTWKQDNSKELTNWIKERNIISINNYNIQAVYNALLEGSIINLPFSTLALLNIKESKVTNNNKKGRL